MLVEMGRLSLGSRKGVGFYVLCLPVSRGVWEHDRVVTVDRVGL